MKKNVIIFLLFSIFLVGCTKNIEYSDLAEIKFSNNEWFANGSDKITIVIIFNEESNLDLINASASITNGTFTKNNSNEIEITPIRDVVSGKVQSIVMIKSSTTNADSEVKININGYEARKFITSKKSVPANLTLKVDKFSIKNNFSEVLNLTGKLLNNANKNVSTGSRVLFEDFLPDGTPAGGKFKDTIINSNSISTVNNTYSVGQIRANEKVTIIATVLDENENKTPIKNTIELLVLPYN